MKPRHPSNPFATSEWLSIPQAAERLGVSRISVFRYVKERKLPAMRVGKQYLIRLEHLRRPINPPPRVRLRPEMRVNKQQAQLRSLHAPSDDRMPGTAAQRLAAMWELTAQNWSLSDPHHAEQRLQRHLATLASPRR